MKTRAPIHHNCNRTLAALTVLTACLLATAMAHSQPVCSSDGEATPNALFERFINADCEACWRDPATPAAKPGALALDWIVPGSQGDAGALAAAASLDALLRLQALRHDRPKHQASQATAVSGWPGASLRVAHGVALGGYLGASIELILPPNTRFDAPLEAWLVLVETLPVGLEASPIPRNLVRNLLQIPWNMHHALSTSEHTSLKEIRSLNIAQGARPERLRVVGWVQDAATGQIRVAAGSVCAAADK